MEIIHIVLGKANPERMNGVNKVVYQLATRQAAAGSRVSVWGISANTEKNYGERNFNTRLYNKYANPFKADEKLLRDILFKKGTAVFHIHGGWVPVFSTLAAFMAKNKVQYVFTPHGAYNTIAMKRSAWVKKIYLLLRERQVLKHAKLVHCIGQSEVSGLEGIYKGANTLLLPYGFDAGLQPLLPKQTPGMVFGFVGRLDIYTKGLDLMLDAFATFNRVVEDAKLWIVGDGPERKRLEKMVRERDLCNSVVLFGSKFGEEKNALIRQMDVFVHPSRNEGLPSSVLEACQFGVPCIVSQATNMAGYVETYQAGLSIANDDAGALLEAMNSLYLVHRSSSFSLTRQNAQQLVKEAFSWEKLIPGFNQLYVA